jgi:uncharacterized membrane protein YqhA
MSTIRKIIVTILSIAFLINMITWFSAQSQGALMLLSLGFLFISLLIPFSILAEREEEEPPKKNRLKRKV